MANELVTPQMKEMFEDLIGTYGWFILAGFLAVLLKDAIHKAVEGFMVFMGKDFQNDDILYISGRQARIVRVGLFKTIFYMTDRKTKMLVPNEQLKQLTIEKTLPKNGGEPYLPKASDPSFIGWEEVPVNPPPMQVEVVEKPTRRTRSKK